jgi:TRAP-type C4-dicarboxylate transport system permease small subunit
MMTQRKTLLDRVIDGAELLAGAFLAIAVAIAFVTVILRYVFSWSLPDGYDISRNLLGILIFWGIGVTGYRGEHITVDLVWGALGAPARRLMDIFAVTVSSGCMGFFAWATILKVTGTAKSSVSTFDLHLPVWPFYAVACVGIVAGVLLILIRLMRLVAGTEAAPPPQADELPPSLTSH